MYSAQHMIIRKNRYPDLHGYLDRNAQLAKNLYNAGLYRVRQVFTGWHKQNRTKNEQEVFDELNQYHF